MLFSSVVFLFLFLPLTLLGYYLIHARLRNYWLLAASLIFFAWGGVSYTLILVISILLNYVFGLLIQTNIDNKWAYRWLFAGVTVNLVMLGVFKYADFLLSNLNVISQKLSGPVVNELHIVLPVGISFYTFHALSYLVDIYRRKTTAQRNIFDLSLYIAMFSQLIAGPIIRYSDVWQQLKNREHTLEKFSSGIERFLIGLGKKVLLANNFARIADDMFAAEPSTLGGLNAWTGIICYSLQIYFDFAGYSDMAIGLGRMFGFNFLENFNYPYISKSVKEFWRRWHISLSSFFRDYVYIPLGGNRNKESRTYLNLLIVFFLTGFWHGASWSFVIWGLFHGFFMIIERLGFEKFLERTWKPVANVYTLLVVIFAWVLFRAETLSYALNYWKAMFDFNVTAEQMDVLMSYFHADVLMVFAIGLSGASGLFNFFGKWAGRLVAVPKPWVNLLSYSYHVISVVFYAATFILCSMYLVSGTYNPFIYYRF